MKYIFPVFFLFLFFPPPVQAQNTIARIRVKRQLAEASCGQCNFKMQGKGCALAVKIDGYAFFADGIHIDDFGDAHAKDGFCEAIRKAEIKGKIVNGRFKATYFKLLPQ